MNEKGPKIKKHQNASFKCSIYSKFHDDSESVLNSIFRFYLALKTSINSKILPFSILTILSRKTS